MARLKGKVALITGGGRGIGRAIALLFAEEGANIAICARTSDELAETQQAVEKLGRRCEAIVCDVGNGAQVVRMVDEVMAAFGRVDVLVNNAATFLWQAFLELTDAEWLHTINTNLNSVYYCCHAVLPHMVRQGEGRVVNISSIHGKHGDANLAHHCAAKFGVLGLTQSLATEFKDKNIHINAICPGQVDTKTEESARLAERALGVILQPQDVARAALFLASDDSMHITGSTIDIYGGTQLKIA